MVQLGAGGAGAAVAYALLDLGVKHLTILDAVPGKADELVARMGQLYSPDRVARRDRPGDRVCEDADGIVHCTPTGMATHPGVRGPRGAAQPRRWVSEIVYFPLETELLRRARAKGCRTVDGGGMAAEQAYEAFYIFTGVRPDGDRMNAHLRAMVGGTTVG